jgi:hypothetical protein
VPGMRKPAGAGIFKEIPGVQFPLPGRDPGVGPPAPNSEGAGLSGSLTANVSPAGNRSMGAASQPTITLPAANRWTLAVFSSGHPGLAAQGEAHPSSKRSHASLVSRGRRIE